jgi:DNA-binding SARP family transcriptional activator
MTLSISVLGVLDIRCGNRATPKIAKKAGALFAYLAAQHGQTVSRERVADLLWPYQQSDQALHSLRNLFWDLRKALGADVACLTITRTACRLDSVPSDLARFDDIAGDTIAELTEAGALYRGPLLEDFPEIASEPWNEWLDAERARLEELLKDRLFKLAELQAVAGEHDIAAATARRLIALDPYGTRSNRLLMRVLAAAGEPTEAVRHYGIFTAILKRELGVGPSVQTRALYEKIRATLPFDQPYTSSELLAEAMAEIERLQSENRELKARNLRLEAREVAQAA